LRLRAQFGHEDSRDVPMARTVAGQMGDHQAPFLQKKTFGNRVLEAVRLDHTLEVRELPVTAQEVRQNVLGGRYPGSMG